MLVRLVGFQLNIEGKGEITLKDFADALAATNPVDPAETGKNRLLFLNSRCHSDYFAGLVVTVKDHRTYCELINSGGSLLVKVNELDHNSSLMDFNFFVFNKTTGAGLYQHYHQSCSAESFGNLAQRRFSEFRKAIRQAALDAAGNGISEAEKKKIESRFSNKIKFSVIVRKEALKALISEMKRVKAFQYALSTPVVEQDAFAPLKPFIRMKSERLTFGVNAPVGYVATAIDTFVAAANLQRGRIEAVDNEGVERIIKIMDNPDSFGEYEFDDLVPKLNALNLTTFEESWVVAELIEKCRNNQAIFEYEVKP